MAGRKLIFKAPHEMAVVPLNITPPAPGMLRVQVQYSAISPGTEMLLYRGQMPADLDLDLSIESLTGGWRYPVAYGYAAVGTVDAVGAGVAEDWLGREVFAFQPHASHFWAEPAAVLPLPAGIDQRNALFLPNMETAVALVMDGRPVIGERVLVMGQGIVGLLTALLLGSLPLQRLAVADMISARREMAPKYCQAEPLAPAELVAAAGRESGGFDLTYELSGNPAALDQAIAATGDFGRIVIGSWYGEKRADLALGGRFHRSHMTLISSQVSELKPAWTGRWTKARRLNVAWEMIRRHQPAQFISHLLPLEQAPAAYDRLDRRPEAGLQTVFTY